MKLRIGGGEQGLNWDGVVPTYARDRAGRDFTAFFSWKIARSRVNVVPSGRGTGGKTALPARQEGVESSIY